jgi:hypothetical protein
MTVPSAQDFWGSPSAPKPADKPVPPATEFWGAPKKPEPEKPGLLARAATAIGSAASPVVEAASDSVKGLASMAAEKVIDTMTSLYNSEGKAEPEPSPLEGAFAQDPAYPQTPLEAASGVSIKPGAEPAYQAQRDALRPPAEVRPMPIGADIASRVRESTQNPVARGAVSGFSQLGQTGVGAVRLAADLAGADDVAKFAGETSRTAGQIGSGSTVDLRGNQKLVADVTSSIMNSAPSLALGAIGGPAMKGLFVQSMLAEYNNGRDAGFDPLESAKRGTIMGFAEAIGERAGFPQQMQLIKGIAKHVPTDRLAKVFGEMLMKEIPGEQLTTAMQFMADKLGPAALAPDATLDQYLEQAGETLKVTLGQTAVMGGGPAALGVARNAVARADRATAAPEQLIAQAIDQAATQYGLSPKAATAVRDKVATMPPDQAAGYAERAFAGFERANLVKKPGAGQGFRATLNDLAEKATQDAEAQPTPPIGESENAAAVASAPAMDDEMAAVVARSLGINLDAGSILGTDVTPEASSAPADQLAQPPSEAGPQVESPPAAAAPAESAAAPIEGEPINKNWSRFTPESGSLDIPREQMPQIKAEHRGALVRFLNARGVEHQSEEVPADSLKPTQGEFSPRKVKQAIDFTGGDRAILVSQDGYVMDGHHQWLAKREAGEPVRVIRLQAPIQDLLRLAHQFPSSYTAGGARNAGNGTGYAEPGRVVEPGPADDTASRGAEPLVQGELQQPVPAGTAGGAVSGAGERDVPGAAGPGKQPPALTAGQVVTLDGAAYTVKALGKNTIKLVDAAGKQRVISDSSVNWPRIKLVSDSSANRDASWVIREKATGKVIMETFDRKKVDALNTGKYEAVPIREHLASLSKPAAKKAPAAADAPARATRAGKTPAASRPAPIAEEFTGQMGEGMAEHVANTHLRRLQKERPELDWSVAEADPTRNPKLKADRYVVQGRPLQSQAKADQAGAKAGGVEPTGAAGKADAAPAGSPAVEADGVEPTLKRGASRGMSVESARRVADLVAQDGRLKKVNVAATLDDMPPKVREAILAKSPDGQVRGAFFPESDEVWVVANNLSGEAEQVFVMLHEAFHRGLHIVLGKEGSAVLRQIYATNKRVRDLADANMKRFGIGKEEATNEALADIAGEGLDSVSNLNGWTRLLKLIRDWLGKLGEKLGIKLNFTDEMIVDLVAGLTHAGLQNSPSVNTGPRTASEWAHFNGQAEIDKRVASGMSFGDATVEVREMAASRVHPELTALKVLAEDDNLFKLPKSEADTVEAIAADNSPDITVRKATLPNREVMWTLTMPGGQIARITQRPADTFGPPVYGYESDGHSYTPVTERPGTNPDEVPENNGDVWIDVSQLKEGNSGQLVYNIAATYAHNTGRIFIGDPSGVSDVALRRRAQHMLSSALKFGTTEHLAPSIEQEKGSPKAGVPPLKWTYGDDLGNIEALINVVLGSIESAGGNPINFRPDTGHFYDQAGRELDERSMGQALRAGRRAEARAGDTTYKGAAVLAALVREEGKARRGGDGRPMGLLERLVALRGEYPVSTGKILHSRKPGGGDGPLLSRALPSATAGQKAATARGYKARAKSVIDRIDHVVNGTGGLPDTEQFLAQRYRALGRIAEVNKVAGQIREAFRKATPDEKRAIYAYLTTAGATADGIATPEVRGMAVLVKRYIDSVGDQLVEHGLLPKEAREEYRDRYLPRMYLSHLLDEGDWRSVGGGKKVSDLGYLKARKEIPQEIRDVLLGEIKDPAFLAATAIAKPMRDMALLDWLDQISMNDNWVMKESLTDWKGKKVSVFWLKAEADALRTRARLYPEEVNRDKATKIAEEMETAASSAMQGADFNRKDYKQIPNTPRYGRLRGIHVRTEIYDDLMGAQDFIPKDPGWAQKMLGYGGWGTKATQMWKMSKVALNPPGQIRNVISNGFMMQLSGVPFHRMPALMARAISQIRNGGQHWKVAQKYGVTESTFQAQEMFRARRDLIELERDMKGMSPWNAMKSVAAAITDFAGDAYQASEALFKTVKIMDAMERQGLSESEAAIEAQKWLFDYSLINKNTRYLRNAPVGAPFLTYTTKVLPRLLEVAALHPYRFLPYVAMYYGLQMWVRATFGGDDDQWEQLKKALPEWMQKKNGIAFLPFRDEAGRLQAVDVSYFFPWSQWADFGTSAARGDAMAALKAMGVAGGPIPDVLSAWKTGKDAFSGRDIINEGDPPAEQAAALLAYAYDMAMPPFISSHGVISPLWLVDPAYGGKFAQAVTGSTNRAGDERSTYGQAMGRLVGLNAYGIDPELTRGSNLAQMQADVQKSAARLRSKLGDQGLSEERREAIVKAYSEEMDRRIKLLEEYEKASEVPEFAKREAKAQN